MFQGVMDEEIRHELGAHYTSIPNIMKVINPLFMDDLREELEKCKGNEKKLKKLQQRVAQIKIFDPACGSGNFLIIAYKELRHFEMAIIEEIGKISGPQLGCLSFMTVDHFYGIEINPFAVELAKLSIWLAEHQMNMEFQRTFRTDIASIPLKNSAHIVAANACRIDWEDVCPKGEEDEIYILGNPPYLGSKVQKDHHKHDLKFVFKGKDNFKFLDYIACWFLKASSYVHRTGYKFSFVTTNSICQGLHVEMLWPHLLSSDLEIIFAYTPFLWKNNAQDRAGVTCTIIGLTTVNSRKEKFLYTDYSKTKYKNINPYLVDGPNVVVKKSLQNINSLPPMQNGNPPREGGILILSKEEREELLTEYPVAVEFIRKLSGSSEFIRNISRWCLWITDNNLELAKSIPPILERIEKVKIFRENGGIIARQCSHTPHKFYMTNMPENSQLIMPTVSSERREYIPSGFLDGKTVVVNSANTIFDPEPFIFGIINSKIHMVWVRAIAGRLKNDFRYAPAMCYNTFPIPKLKEAQKEQLEELSFNILEARDMHPGKTLAELYDPDKMPQNLRDAHHELDLAVDAIYRKEPFKNDEERLAHLFKLYEKMTKGEKK